MHQVRPARDGLVQVHCEPLGRRWRYRMALLVRGAQIETSTLFPLQFVHR